MTDREGDIPKESTLGIGVAATREAAVARAKMTAPKDFILSCVCVLKGMCVVFERFFVF